jgi:hypothetical protein
MLRRLSAIFLGLSTPESYSCDEFVKQTITSSAIALCGQFAFADADSSAASTPRPDKSQYTLFNPTPIDLRRRTTQIDRARPTARTRSMPAFSKSKAMCGTGRLITKKAFALAPGSLAIGIGLSMNAPPVRPLRPCRCTRAEFPLKQVPMIPLLSGSSQQPKSSRIRPQIWVFLLKHPKIGPNFR